MTIEKLFEGERRIIERQGVRMYDKMLRILDAQEQEIARLQQYLHSSENIYSGMLADRNEKMAQSREQDGGYWKKLMVAAHSAGFTHAKEMLEWADKQGLMISSKEGAK